MAAFATQTESNFRSRLRTLIANTLAESGTALPESRVDERIEAMIQQCADFRLVRECDIARYAQIICRSSKAFPDRPPHSKQARNILMAYGVDPQLKLDRLELLLTPDLARPVARRS